MKAWIVIDFKINQSYIAQNLCINRDVPITTCHGSCYLATKLKKVEEPEQQELPTNLIQKVDTLYFSQEKIKQSKNIGEMQVPFNFSERSFIYNFEFHQGIFRPPISDLDLTA